MEIKIYTAVLGMCCRIKSRIVNLYGSWSYEVPYKNGKVNILRQMARKMPYEMRKVKSIRQGDKKTAV